MEKGISNYVTYNVTLYFADGNSMSNVEVTIPRKAYWAGQLEREIIRTYNHNKAASMQKVVKVHVFRNFKEGGIMIDNIHRRVVHV